MNDVDDTSTDELVEQLRRTALICDGTDADLLNASANRLNALYYATTDLPKRQPWVACHDCGLPYGDDGWCDCVVPNDVWRLVAPAGDEGGILCLHCIARRLVRLGLHDVPLTVTSGPFRQTESEKKYGNV